MSQKITIKNIHNYIDGNSNYLMDKLRILSEHIKEQVNYRLTVCKEDCLPAGKCKVCSCPLPNRAYSISSCNSDRFPDIMDEADWNKFKIDNEIK